MELDREPGYGEIGYWVVADARGRGVATRAVRLLADWARDELRLTHIDVLPHKDNVASRRVAEKAGFVDTGELIGSPRADTEEPIYAVYVWRRT
jgi:RimJ/RimL family protein N-acetyltransferase